MNHELSGNFESQDTEQSKWDSIGDEVQFKGETEPSDEISEFVDKMYSDRIDSIIDGICFDGGDHSSRSNYVTSNILIGTFTDKEQEEMITRRMNDESIGPEFTERLKENLAERIRSLSIADEVKSDPFLRRKHMDWIAGRFEDLGSEGNELRDLLWGADGDHFYQSGAAIALMFDADFLKKSYGAEMDETKTKEISDCVSNLVQDGETTVKEIVRDPFLRKRHFESMVEIETVGLEVNTSLANLWKNDENFTESFEYRNMLYDVAMENPDVYEQVDDNAIEDLTNKALEQIPPVRIREIIRTYEKNPRQGDEYLLKTLLPILGLSNNPPKLDYGPSTGHEDGYYTRSNHSITICEERIKEKENSDEDRIMKTSSLFGIFRTKKVKDELFRRMGVVAHETWHAHQWGGDNVDMERRKKYQSNFVYYMNGKDNYHSYRSQLIEKEAWAFGSKFEEKCRSECKS